MLRRCEDAIDHNWGSGGPGGGVPFNDFSARWTRTVDFADGTHQFTARATTATGVGRWRPGHRRVEGTGATTYTATRDLEGAHDVVMEYYERGGQAVAQLDWTTTPAGTVALDGADVGGPGAGGLHDGRRRRLDGDRRWRRHLGRRRPVPVRPHAAER